MMDGTLMSGGIAGRDVYMGVGINESAEVVTSVG